MSLIPERLWQLMTAAEREVVLSTVNGFRHEPRVTCPQCNASLGVRLKVTAGAVLIENDAPVLGEKGSGATAPKLSPEESDLIESAERTGLLKAFGSAVRAAKPANAPADMGKFLLIFLRTAVPKNRIPSFALRRLKSDLNEDDLSFVGAQGIVAVLAGGVIRTFVPLSYLVGASVTALSTGKVKGRLMADHQDLDVWVRGRYGYVPLSSENFMNEIRRKNLGEFCEFVQ